MVPKIKGVLKLNVRALIQRVSGRPLRSNETGVTRLVDLGMANGTAQRVLDDVTDVRLETLEQVATALKVKPWELLNPSTAETMGALPSADAIEATAGVAPDPWPFKNLEYHRFDALEPYQKIEIQAKVRELIKDFEDAKPASRSANGARG